MRAGAVEVQLDDDVRLRRLSLDASHVSSSCCDLLECACWNSCHFVGRADGHAQPSFGSSLPDQDAAVDQRPARRRGGRRTGRTARSSRRTPRPRCPRARQPGREIVAGGAQLVDLASSSSLCRSAASAAAWRHRRQVVRQPHDAQGVDDRGVGGDVAEASAGERERLAHRARDRAAAGSRRAARAPSACRRAGTRRTPRRPRRRRAPRRAPPAPASSGSAVPVGLFGDASSTTSGCSSPISATARSTSMREVVLALPGDPAGVGVARVLGIHRVRRRERQRRAPGPAERLQHLQHHLVRPVGRPDAGRRSARGRGSRPGRCAALAPRGRGSGSGSPRRQRPRRRCPRRPSAPGAYGFSLTLRLTRSRICGAPYGSSSRSSSRTGTQSGRPMDYSPARSVRDRHGGTVRRQVLGRRPGRRRGRRRRAAPPRSR